MPPSFDKAELTSDNDAGIKFNTGVGMPPITDERVQPTPSSWVPPSSNRITGATYDNGRIKQFSGSRVSPRSDGGAEQNTKPLAPPNYDGGLNRILV